MARFGRICGRKGDTISKQNKLRYIDLKKKIAIALLLIGLAVWGYSYFQLNERNRYAISSAQGSIDEGSVFDVATKTPYSQANEIMISSGFKFAFKKEGKYFYLDSGWRRGTVILVVEQDLVQSISWNYQLGAL